MTIINLYPICGLLMLTASFVIISQTSPSFLDIVITLPITLLITQLTAHKHQKRQSIKQTIEELIQEYTLPNLTITNHLNPTTIFFNQNTTQSIQLIIQEALKNITKHANATKAEIRLDVLPETTTLFIQDNGVGFNPKKSSSKGLAQIHKQVTALGGTLQIDSEPYCGCALWIRIPDQQSITTINCD